MLVLASIWICVAGGAMLVWKLRLAHGFACLWRYRESCRSRKYSGVARIESSLQGAQERTTTVRAVAATSESSPTVARASSPIEFEYF